ncbi:hypothetical protein GJAV_G00263030 [Gymnothorax javanicus]|nr:hypothetical protein GJAV_G00263030 [Gymnothorax javanicus]
MQRVFCSPRRAQFLFNHPEPERQRSAFHVEWVPLIFYCPGSFLGCLSVSAGVGRIAGGEEGLVADRCAAAAGKRTLKLDPDSCAAGGQWTGHLSIVSKSAPWVSGTSEQLKPKVGIGGGRA